MTRSKKQCILQDREERGFSCQINPDGVEQVCVTPSDKIPPKFSKPSIVTDEDRLFTLRVEPVDPIQA